MKCRNPSMRGSLAAAVCLTTAVLSVALAGCTPRVEVALPDKPIEINVNAKIQHEILVKVDRDVSKLVEQNDDLF